MENNGAQIVSRLTPVDWCILAAFPAVVVAIGLSARRHVRGMDDYALAGRTVKPRLGLASIIVSEMGLLTFLYAAQRGLTEAFTAFLAAVLSGLICLVVAWSGFIVQPLRRLGVRTVPQFYARRYSRGVAVLGGLVLCSASLLSVGLLLKSGCVFLLNYAGLDASPYLPWLIGLLMLVLVVYTMSGGMVAVLCKDYLQFVLLSVGLLLTLMFALHRLEWDNIFLTINDLRGRGGFNPFHPEESWLSTQGLNTLWLCVTLLGSCTIFQPLLLRTGSIEHVPAMRKTLGWASLGFLMRMMIPMFIGICSLVYLTQWPSLKEAVFYGGQVDDQHRARMATATFLRLLLPAGLLGVTGAALVGSFLSALDGYLVSWSTILSQDVLAPLLRRPPSDRQQVTMARVLVPLLGMLMLVWGLSIPLTYDLWHYVLGFGAVYITGALPVIILGLYWKRSSPAGAYAAMLTGLGSVLALRPVQEKLGLDWQPATMNLAILAAAFAAMAAVSLLRPGRPAAEDWNADHPSAEAPKPLRRSRVEIAPDHVDLVVNTGSTAAQAAAPSPPQEDAPGDQA